jgi:phosphoribosylformylglycinamidine synthase
MGGQTALNLAVALAEACMASGLGVNVEVPAGTTRLDRLLFAEGGARILVGVAAEQAQAWQQALDQAGGAGLAIPAQRLGQVQASAELVISQADQVLVQLPISELQKSYEQAIPRRMATGV